MLAAGGRWPAQTKNHEIEGSFRTLLNIAGNPALAYMIDFYFALTVAAVVALVVLFFWAALVTL